MNRERLMLILGIAGMVGLFVLNSIDNASCQPVCGEYISQGHYIDGQCICRTTLVKR